MAAPDATLREMLIEVAPPQLRTAGRALVAAEGEPSTSRTPLERRTPGMAYAEALTTWGDLGGYELEAQWASAVQRVVKSPVDDVGTRRVGELSGGERKRLVLDLVLNSGRRHPPARRARQLPRHPDPLVAGGAAPPDEVDRADGQPRPSRARRGGDEGDRHRRVGRVGARRFVRHVPAGPRRSPGAARRRARRDGRTRSGGSSAT